jgi:branched-chain amino acid aminotransferase
MDRGFLYGDSVYEVFRTYDGVPLFYDEHWRRFENSARLIRMELGFSKEQVTEQIRATIAASEAPRLRRDVYVRYVVTRGEGELALLPARSAPTRLVVIVKAVPAWNPEFYARGVRVAIADTRRNPGNALNPNIKGGNYLNNVLGAIEADAAGADDCLMLDNNGLVTEASNSNVFFVIDGRLVTPSQRAANLQGLTKAALHDACRAEGLATAEIDIAPDDAARATECFLTSATREVMPVRELILEGGARVAFPAGGGDITRRAAACYKAFVAAYLARHADLSMF